MGKEEISQKVTEIKAEVELLEKKLNGFQSNQKKPVTKEELATAQKDRQKFLVEWRKRKRMVKDRSK